MNLHENVQLHFFIRQPFQSWSDRDKKTSPLSDSFPSINIRDIFCSYAFFILCYIFFYLSHRENSSRPYKYLLKQRIEDGVTHKNAHKHIHPCTTERACGCPRAYRYAASFIPGFSRPVWRVSRASTMQRSHCVLAAVQLQGYTYFSSYVTYQCEVFSYIKLNSLSTR